MSCRGHTHECELRLKTRVTIGRALLDAEFRVKLQLILLLRRGATGLQDFFKGPFRSITYSAKPYSDNCSKSIGDSARIQAF